MKILLLFGLFPQENYSEIIDNSKGVIQYAADALQKSFIEGLGSLRTGVEILNLPYLGSYPTRYKRLYSPVGEFRYITQNGNIALGKNVRFCNFAGLKMYSRYLETKRSLRQWCKNNENEDKVVLIYAIHTPFLKACTELKEQGYASLKIILIVPDLPVFMCSKESLILSALRKKNEMILETLYPKVDAFVLLSKYMIELLPIENKKWIVIEGIFNNIQDDSCIDDWVDDSRINYIFYSGTLARRYGILNLVQAFTGLTNPDIRLVICGAGDAENDIIQYAHNDDRIIYKGQLPRFEVLKLQKKANLLVNPRSPEGEYTKFSFPSKTMEYLASGVPTLLYKLPGIPDEYYQYCFSLEELSVQALAGKIMDILDMDSKELKNIGVKARNFILENKNPIAQSKKIINLINSLK